MGILKLIKEEKKVIKLLEFPIQIPIILSSIPSLSLLYYD